MVLSAGGARKLALIVEYDGTNYAGFQFQTNAPTVQGILERALYQLTGVETRISGASRTDAGVHARGQVAAFRANSSLRVDVFVRGLNYYLPQDVAIRDALEVDPDFDPRRHAYSRVYRYTIVNRLARSPLERLYAYQVTMPLNLEAMARSCAELVGRRDWAALCGPWARPGSSTVRTVYRSEVRQKGEKVFFEIEAESFLPQQVRRTVGTLLQVGMNRMGEKELKSLVEKAVPGTGGPAVPARGLCLVRVKYPNSYPS